jgi:hypothetical protein
MKQSLRPATGAELSSPGVTLSPAARSRRDGGCEVDCCYVTGTVDRRYAIMLSRRSLGQ